MSCHLSLHCIAASRIISQSTVPNWISGTVLLHSLMQGRSNLDHLPSQPDLYISIETKSELSCSGVITCPWHTGPSRQGTPSPGHSAPSTGSPPWWPCTPPCSPSSMYKALLPKVVFPLLYIAPWSSLGLNFYAMPSKVQWIQNKRWL